MTEQKKDTATTKPPNPPAHPANPANPPRDGDADGKTGDGTSGERQAPPASSL